MAQANYLGFIGTNDSNLQLSSTLYGNVNQETTPGSSKYLGSIGWVSSEKVCNPCQQVTYQVQAGQDCEDEVDQVATFERNQRGSRIIRRNSLTRETAGPEMYASHLNCKVPSLKKGCAKVQAVQTVPALEQPCLSAPTYRHYGKTGDCFTDGTTTSTPTCDSTSCTSGAKQYPTLKAFKKSPSLSITSASSVIPGITKSGARGISSGCGSDNTNSSSAGSGEMSSPSFSSSFSSSFMNSATPSGSYNNSDECNDDGSGTGDCTDEGTSDGSSTSSTVSAQSVTDTDGMGKKAKLILSKGTYTTSTDLGGTTSSTGGRRSISMHGISQAARASY